MAATPCPSSLERPNHTFQRCPVRPASSPQVDGPNSQTTLLEETYAGVWPNPISLLSEHSSGSPSAGADHYLSFPRPRCLVTFFPPLGPQLRLGHVQLHRNQLPQITPCLYDACYGKWPPPLPLWKKLWRRWRTSDQPLQAGTRQLRLMYVLHSRPHSHSRRGFHSLTLARSHIRGEAPMRKYRYPTVKLRVASHSSAAAAARHAG
jgi:hypothetical protein